MRFKTASDLKVFIEKNVQNALVNEVATNIKSTMVEMIEENVYGAYSDPPVMYPRRRYDGGLADPDNMIVELRGNTLIVTNVTQASDYGWDDGCEGHYAANLVELVEMGDGHGGSYTHKHSSKPEGPTFLAPRPFVQPTIDEVKRGKQHVNGLRYGLRMAGIKTRVP